MKVGIYVSFVFITVVILFFSFNFYLNVYIITCLEIEKTLVASSLYFLVKDFCIRI